MHLPKELTSKLYRYRGFSTPVSTIYTAREYFEKASSMDSIQNENMKSVVGHMQMKIIESTDEHSSFIESLYELLKYARNSCRLPKLLVEELDRLLITSPSLLNSTIESINNILHYEINGVRKEYYISMCESPNQDELRNLLQTNHMHPSLSWILPHAASNAFSLPLMIIPACNNLPILPVFPEASVLDEPLFLLYNGSSNMFFALLNKDSDEKNVTLRCSCGANDKVRKQKCVHTYRCICFRSNVNCNTKCYCKGCSNKKPLSTSLKRRRSRIPPILSEQQQLRSLDYVLFTGNNPQIAPISTIQHFLLEACLFYAMMDMKSNFEDLTSSFISARLFQEYVKVVGIIKVNNWCPEKELMDCIEILHQNNVERWVAARKKKALLLSQFLYPNKEEH